MYSDEVQLRGLGWYVVFAQLQRPGLVARETPGSVRVKVGRGSREGLRWLVSVDEHEYLRGES